jgi:hypothetical protein
VEALSSLDPVFGCVISSSRLDADGYAFHGKTRAHIAAWTEANGPIPEGMELDHLCRRRACKALRHLELVTRSENELRKSWKYRARKTKCPRGHAMQFALVTPEGGRLCRTCHNEAGRQ